MIFYARLVFPTQDKIKNLSFCGALRFTDCNALRNGDFTLWFPRIMLRRVVGKPLFYNFVFVKFAFPRHEKFLFRQDLSAMCALQNFRTFSYSILCDYDMQNYIKTHCFPNTIFCDFFRQFLARFRIDFSQVFPTRKSRVFQGDFLCRFLCD